MPSSLPGVAVVPSGRPYWAWRLLDGFNHLVFRTLWTPLTLYTLRRDILVTRTVVQWRQGVESWVHQPVMSRLESPLFLRMNMSSSALVALRRSNLGWVRTQLDARGDVVNVFPHVMRNVVLVAGNGLGSGGKVFVDVVGCIEKAFCLGCVGVELKPLYIGISGVNDHFRGL